jgi:precorrin-4/cobalt-precorrin-4 C11-methyltransferase
LAAFAATGATLALHLAVQRLDVLAPELAEHYGWDCPVAVVQRASQPGEVVLRGTLADICDQVREAGIATAAMIFVGRVLEAHGFPDSHLYSASRHRSG